MSMTNDNPLPLPEVDGNAIYVTGNTIYQENKNGVSRWYAVVYPGYDGDGELIYDEECRSVARSLSESARTAARPAPLVDEVMALAREYAYAFASDYSDARAEVDALRAAVEALARRKEAA